MPASILVAGLDGRALLLEAPVLRREGHTVEEKPSARALLAALAEGGARLVVLGPRLPDLGLADTVRRIRADPGIRQVSILVLLPAGEPADADGKAVEAGANAVLRRPLQGLHLESWISKLLAVARRIRARIPVQGHVVGTPTVSGAAHFLGLTRNLSVHGMLLASPVRLEKGPDLELEFLLPGQSQRLAGVGRVVREASEVGWPYLGYGIEFLTLPPDHREAIARLLAEGPPLRLPDEAGDVAPGIQSTVRREAWIYEILAPVLLGECWQVEIRRAPRDHWRPGAAGPFYVVESPSPEEALRLARDFVARHG